MKNLLKYLPLAGISILAASAFVSCSDEGFATDSEGVLKMRMIINSEVTRDQVNSGDLAENCIIYISNEKGLIHKYQGLANVPSELVLKSGNYVAEAWAGDSVTASFDKKFYKAYQPFTMQPGVNNITLNCKIANVVASVNSESIDSEKMTDYKVTVGNTRGYLEFDSENVASAVGYYMMPDEDTSLTWTITGKDVAGRDFSKTGVIENVKSAHHYTLNVKYGTNNEYASVGGACITIVVDDTQIEVEDEVIIHSAPKIKGAGFDITAPVSASPGAFNNLVMTTAAFGSYKSLTVDFGAAATAFGLSSTSYNLYGATDMVKELLNGAGLTWSDAYDVAEDITSGKLQFAASMLNKLGEGKYPVKIELTSSEGLTTAVVLELVVTDALVQAEEVQPGDVKSRSAAVSITILKDRATNPAIEYREVGSTVWNRVEAAATRAVTLTATLANLKPGTNYEYRAVCDDFVESTTHKFKTESVFVLPNASFEDWGESDGVIIPNAGGQVSFWDSGNHGAKLASTILTDKSTDMVHSGQYSARLESKFASVMGIGKMAAGNIFTGSYDGTEGTNGLLTFGRPFDGSHPVKLRGWANYRPATVQSSDNKEGSQLTVGQPDHAQIYVALASAPSKIRTKTKEFFNPAATNILAYGEVTWTGNFGPDGQLQEFEIAIEPRDGYFTAKPAYLIIVASASKYGDYFSGGRGSVLYLDDLELVYE